MSVSVRAMARHPSGSGPAALRIAMVSLLVLSLLAALAITTTSAGPPDALDRLGPAEARAAGSEVVLLARDDLAPGLVEVRMASASASVPLELLAVAADGSRAAFAPRRGLDPTRLTIAQPDGGQTLVDLEGVVGAAFAPDASTLAVVDGSGALLSVDLVAGSVSTLAPGPFLGPLEVTGDGAVMLLAVPSVEAPFESRLVRFEPTSGALTALAPDGLVYGARSLDDGSLAVVVHQTGGGTLVRRLTASGASVLADLGVGAVNVSVAPDGRSLAFERAGEVFLTAPGMANLRRLGSGSAPQVAPDGRSVLVRTSEGGLELIAVDGGRTPIAGAAAFAACGRCRP
ncbi:MAG TPA: hypothetical protein VFH63_04405 [candidate division Zixibacteria bacterium]|nr:hypothetical protein [candidate division Zixibacteria bacterium]